VPAVRWQINGFMLTILEYNVRYYCRSLHLITYTMMSSSTPNSSTINAFDSSKRSPMCTSRLSKVWTSRILFLSCLCGVAAILGYTANQLLTDSEKKLACKQFESISDRALYSAQESLLRKKYSAISLAAIVSNGFPDAQTWPFVKINGFEAISNNLIQTSAGRSNGGRTMGLCPLVTPDQLSDFEDFAYEEVIGPKFPNGTGVSSFGKGVFSVDVSLNTTDNRYHETDGTTTWGSPNKIFSPFLYHSLGGEILMGNFLHSLELFGTIVDDIIACSNVRAASENIDSVECSELSDVLILRGSTTDVVSTPGAIIMHPIYPENNKTVVRSLSYMVWASAKSPVVSA
jgi:hypothetical protein